MALPIVLASLLIAGASTAASALDGSRFLWFNQPARQHFFEDAMPIGNGRIGATVYGGGSEVIGINENSIWTGPFQDRIAKDPQTALAVTREMLLDGRISEARHYSMAYLIPETFSPRAFSYFGNINIDFGHKDSDLTDYVRWLDTKEATTSVSYTYAGMEYSREYVASLPDGVLVASFNTSTAGALNLKISMSREGSITTTAAAEGDRYTVTLVGSSGQSPDDDPIRWTGQARFALVGGIATVTNSTLVISNSTAVQMFFDTETNYRFTEQAEWEAEMTRKIDQAYLKGYQQVKAEAVLDSSSLLDRVTLDLGASPDGIADLPTDQRVANAKSSSDDIQLTTLVFNYGRHLLVSSSRTTSNGTSLPANLQGIWNNSTSAPWGGKYTININIQMNYWPAGPTNLIETQEPLFDLMSIANARGKSYAERMYGCPGTVFHHNLDLWGDPAPTDNYTQSTLWPVGAAWLSWHMMDHYRFTGNKVFLRDVVYPFLVDVATFFECYCMEYNGYNTTGPSVSPENSFYVPDNMTVPGAKEPVDIGPAMDGQLIGEALESLIEAAEILGIEDDDADVAAARQLLPTLLPQQIGSLGQILEWRHEYREAAVGQKHLSPLVGLMPGRQFSPLRNATLASAAEGLLRRRVSNGSGSTGWSRTWLINSFARVFDGDSAWEELTKWFQKFPTPYNLYNTDAGSPNYVFQIDGNFGFVSGIAEMLLQSHAGVVHLLPALPSAVPTGSVRGLVSRGNFVVDIAWDRGALTSANITSRAGAELAIRYMNGSQIAVDGMAYSGPLGTTTGTTYVVTPS